MPEKSDCKNWSAKSCHVMTAREQRGQVLLLRPRKEGPTPAVRGTWGEAPQRRQRRPRGGGAGDGGGDDVKSNEVTAGGSRPSVEVELTCEKMGLVLFFFSFFRHTWSTGATAEKHKRGKKFKTANQNIRTTKIRTTKIKPTKTITTKIRTTKIGTTKGLFNPRIH